MAAPRRVVVIGAARSGTKILRDSLAAAAGGGAVPYDANFVWRYGNESAVDDILTPGDVSPKTARFIARYVDSYARGDLVVEKTVSNALRVAFVHRVLPDAAFVHIVRDGVDAVQSTREQWLARASVSYLRKKVLHVPWRVAMGYGRKYAVDRLRSRGSERAGTWGVRYPGIDDDVLRDSLLQVCARQWRESVERASAELPAVDADVVLVRYEELVTNPRASLEQVLSNLRLPLDVGQVRRAASSIVDDSRGKGAKRLSTAELRTVAAEIDSNLATLGYASATARGDQS